MNSAPESHSDRQLFGYDQTTDTVWVALPGMGSQALLRIPGAWLRAKMPSPPDLRPSLVILVPIFVILFALIAAKAPFAEGEPYLIGLGALAGAYAEKIGNSLARLRRERRRKARP